MSERASREAPGHPVPFAPATGGVGELAALAALSPQQRELLDLLLAEQGLDPDRLPIPRRARPGERTMASFAQQRLWFLHQLEPLSPRYNVPTAVELRGRLSPGALAAALGEVVRRHETLRTVFEDHDGLPAQRILAAADTRLQLPLLDLSGLPADAARRVLDRLLAERIDRPFDLALGPIFHATLFRLADDRCVLLLVVHHIAADAWSMSIWIEEVSAAYGAMCAGGQLSLPALPIQYADFAAWQRQRISGARLEREIEHWRSRLAGLEPLALARDRSPGEGPRSGCGRECVVLEPSLVAAMHDLARHQGVTPFVVLTAALDLLLSRTHGRDEVAIGSPVAGRTRVELERLIGFFVNTLVLRTSLSGGPTFAELLARVHEVALAALAHQELPFEKLVEALQPDRRGGETPLFSVLLTLQNLPSQDLDLGGLSLRSLPVTPSATRFDWIVYGRGDDAAFQLELEYRADLFRPSTCLRALRHLETLLANAVASPRQPISELSLLGAGERHQLLVEAGAERHRALPVPSFLERFESWAAHTPQAPALRDGEVAWSFGELNARANRLARLLVAQGVGPEIPVALFLERSAPAVLAILAVLKAGGAYVPIEPPLSAARLAKLLDEVGARVALTSEALAAELPGAVEKRIALDSAAVRAALARESPADLALAIPDQALAYVIHTSGSTGLPKGIGVERVHLARYLAAVLASVPPLAGGSFALLSTLAADLGNTTIFAALATGGCLNVLGADLALDAERLADTFERHPVDVLKLVPSHLRALLAATRPQAILPRRLLLLGGEACDPRLIRRVAELAPACSLFNHYGPTETTVGVIAGRIDAATDGAQRSVPLGRPLPGAICSILDRSQQLQPPGVAGELYVSGGTVARGYLGHPDLTAERFLPASGRADAGARRYRTGDLVRRRDDGRLEFLGRIDQQVRVRGFRVEPEGIEALLRRHPAVAACAVAVADQGEAIGNRLVAYVVAQGEPPGPPEIRRYLADHLPPAMVPDSILFLPALPLTANGKLDRSRLPPAGARPLTAPGRRAATALEEIVAAAWCAILQRDEVGVDESFFSAGGHSLLATQIASRLSGALGCSVPLRLLLDAPTIAGQAEQLAAILASGPCAAPPAITRHRAEDEPLPLSFAQERLWVLDRLALRPTAYLLHYFADLSGPLAPDLLGRALAEVARRHEVLRTCYPSRDGSPRVQLLPAPRAFLPVVDLRGLAGGRHGADAAAGETLRLALAATQRSFDLGSDLPWRACVVRQGEASWTLLLSLHHIVSDAWSRELLVRELLAIYSALRRGAAAALPELAVQYADFALWQRRYLRGEILESLLGYWRRQLEGCHAAELPTDRARPAAPSHRGAGLTFLLPPSLHGEIRGLAQHHLATPFMVLLTALDAILYRYSGHGDVAVGSPIANRHHLQLEPLLGFFVNMLVLRVRLDRGDSFQQALARARQVALEAYAHQDLPFEKLLDELPLSRDLRRQPLFQVVFAFQHAAAAPPELAELHPRPLALDSVNAKFELSLLIESREGETAGVFEYATDLFDRTTIARLRGHWEALLRGAAAAPAVPLADLPLLSPPEAHQLEREWNSPASRDEPSCAHQLIAEQARRTPRGTAISWAGGELSFGELERRANRLARRLRRHGVGAESIVALHLRRSPALVIAMLAVWKAGGAYLPLDLDHPPAQRLWRLGHAGCRVVLAQHGAGGLAVPAGVEWIDDWIETAAEPSESPRDDTAPAPLAVAQNLAYVLFTSGTTGEPKGVMISHAALCNYLRFSAGFYRVAAGGLGAPVHSPLGFDLTVTALLTPLAAGASVVLLPEEHGLEALSRGLLDHPGFSLVKLTPAHLELLRWLIAPEQTAGRAACFVIGGEALRAETIAWLRELAPGSRLINEYGPTETVVGCAVYEVPGDGPPAPGVVPIGKPIAATTLHVVDPALHLAPLGALGELLIGGAGVGRGYLGRPDLTAERFVPDPFSATPGARLYRSGDLGRRRSDGILVYVGRRDSQVKIRGHRVELEEVEAALAQHPRLRAAAVAAFPSRAGHLELAAFAVPLDGEPPAPEELRGFLAARLPAAMVPAAYVLLPDLPLTRNGKVDRARLPRPAEPPELEANPPDGAVAGEVAALWRQVLRRDAVGTEENFFDLGGNSLLLVELQERLRRRFGREISAIDLFQHPTVASQAALVATAGTPSPAPLARPPWQVDHDVAIIGLAGRFPGADTVAELWQNLRAGRETIRSFSRQELAAAGVDAALLGRPDYVAAGGELAGVELFDADFFGMSPREAELTDPQQRLMLELAWSALEDAGYAPGVGARRVGVFAGSSLNRYWFQLAGRPDLAAGHEMQLVLSNDKDFLASRISYKLNFTGPSVAVQTACSSSLVAVHAACRSLLQGECAMALAGGVAIRLPQRAGYVYQEGGIASPDGHCRPFSALAQGTVSGNGLGLVVLKRLADAVADGDCIRAVIKGSAVNNDGALKVGYAAPGVDGQAQVIAEALAAAGVAADSLSYVEAHGTGTALGDPVEVAALSRALGGARATPGSCALGSIKSNIGHLDAAAGIAGLIKTVLALQHRELPPTLHCEPPNPAIDFAAGPLRLLPTLGEWRSTGPLRAGVSSFGIGGTNAHVIVEEAPVAAPAAPARPCHLLVLSARSPSALATARAELAAHLRQRPDAPLADVAYTLQVGRKPWRHRLVLPCATATEAAAALADTASMQAAAGQAGDGEPTVVFLFPGQGAQHLRMGRELYRDEALVRDLVDQGAELLVPALGLDLRRLLFPPAGDEGRAAGELRSTAVAQPALFLIAYAVARLWRRCGVTPARMIGHSLGEYVAACMAGVFSFQDALALVAARGRLMASCPPGAMLAVPLSEPELEALLPAELSLAAANGPERSVVAGPCDAIEAFERHLAAREIAVRRLATSHAFHCALVDPILDRFRTVVEGVPLQPPRLPIVSAVTGDVLPDDEATRPDYWVRQLRAPVRFGAALRRAAEDPRAIFLEVGPGRTLSAVARRDPAMHGRQVLASLADPARPERGFVPLLSAMGRLWLAGVTIDWHGWQAGEGRRRISLPTYPFERRRHWIDTTAAACRLDGRPEAGGARSESWYHQPAWQQTAPAALLPSRHRRGEGAWLVFAHPGSLAGALRRALDQRGQRAVFVSPGPAPSRTACDFTVRLHHAGDCEALLGRLREEGINPVFVLYLWSLAAAGGAPANVPDLYCHDLLHLVQALAAGDPENRSPLHLGLVSAGLQEVTGDEDLDPQQALLLGLCRCLPSEAPRFSCRSIDLSPVELGAGPPQLHDLACCLLDEMLLDGEEEAVAYRRGNRWSETYAPLQPPAFAARSLPWRQGGVYLVTGGLGGIGFEIARHLHSTAGARLVLVGRSPVPPAAERGEEIERLPPAHPQRTRLLRLAALEAAGAEVLALAADVADPAQVHQLVHRAHARFGAVHGILHSAGVPASGLLAAKTDDIAHAGLAPKVRGARNLAAAFDLETLDFLVLFSSLRTVLGGPGRSDYVAGNAFLGALAYQLRRQHPRTAVVAIDWDTWRETGMSAEAAAALGRRPEEAFPTGLSSAEGIEVLQRSVAAALPRIVVSTRDLQAARREARAVPPELPPAPRVQPALARPAGRSHRPPRTAPEQVLAAIWQELLGIEAIGVDESFFALGGDSIVGLQVVARARKRGLALTPRQVFEAQTIEQLAAVATSASASLAARPRPASATPLPLTPIQRWFFTLPLPDRHHWNQAVLIQSQLPIDPPALRAALAAILEQHEALRLRFHDDGGEWTAVAAAPAAAPPAAVVDLSRLPAGVRARTLETCATAAQGALDLGRGPLVRTVLFRWGNAEPARLLLVAHHLVVDAVSWRILLEDLEDALDQYGATGRVELQPPSTSFLDWALGLREHACSAAVARELDYWLAPPRHDVERLPVDFPGGANRTAAARTVQTHLGHADTQRLLREAPEALHADMQVLLLTALARAFRRWTGRRRLLVEMEGHGREPIFDGADLSRTVGWFTTLFPLLLELPEVDDETAGLRRVKEQVQACPSRGTGFGLLRFAASDLAAAARLAALPGAEVKLLYLGQMDHALRSGSRFAAAPESSGDSVSSRGPRSHLLDVNARVFGGELHLAWTYSATLHLRTTIERLAAAMIEELSRLAARARTPSPQPYTPADFPQAGLSADDLGELMAQLRSDGDD